MGDIQIFPDDRYFELTFLTLQESTFITLSPNKKFLDELTALFTAKTDDEEGKRILEAIQQCTPEFLSKLQEFVAIHKQELPVLNQVAQFFRKLLPDSFFLIVFGRVNDTNLYFNYYNHLRQFHVQKGLPVAHAPTHWGFGGILTIYNMHFFGHQRRTIGIGPKDERICRFCGGKQGDTNSYGALVSFRNKAHAYSEALGNKLVILTEECDACNDRFSRTIEPSIIIYFSVFRALHGLKGKGSFKTLKGQNFELSSDGKLIDIFYDGEIETPKGDELPLKEPIALKLRDRFVPQDVYRSLCKFVLSVVSQSQLRHFERTLEWINGEFNVERLPPVALLQDYTFFKDEPALFYYQRKIKDYRCPYLVGEFHYAHLVLVFVVPFSMKDTVDFSGPEAHQEFWRIFNQFRKDKEWTFQDFEEITPKEMMINFSVKDGRDSAD
jgi:hypothetical protein